MDGLTPFGVSIACRVFSVECRVPLGSGELRSGLLGPSEWCTLQRIIKYAISDVLLAASWAAPRRLHLLATKLTHCTRRSIRTFYTPQHLIRIAFCVRYYRHGARSRQPPRERHTYTLSCVPMHHCPVQVRSFYYLQNASLRLRLCGWGFPY